MIGYGGLMLGFVLNVVWISVTLKRFRVRRRGLGVALSLLLLIGTDAMAAGMFIGSLVACWEPYDGPFLSLLAGGGAWMLYWATAASVLSCHRWFQPTGTVFSALHLIQISVGWALVWTGLGMAEAEQWYSGNLPFFQIIAAGSAWAFIWGIAAILVYRRAYVRHLMHSSAGWVTARRRSQRRSGG